MEKLWFGSRKWQGGISSLKWQDQLSNPPRLFSVGTESFGLKPFRHEADRTELKNEATRASCTCFHCNFTKHSCAQQFSFCGSHSSRLRRGLSNSSKIVILVMQWFISKEKTLRRKFTFCFVSADKKSPTNYQASLYSLKHLTWSDVVLATLHQMQSW